jgi:hypothetical protein
LRRRKHPLAYIHISYPSCSSTCNPLQDIVLHRGITISRSSSRGSSSALRVCGVSDKVVSHLRVELFGRLLCGTAVLSTAGSLLRSWLAGGTSLGGIGAMLDSSSRLGLRLGLADALTKSLGLWDEIGGSNNDLDLG